MAIKIKNIDSVNQTWLGQEFTPDFLYVCANSTEAQKYGFDSDFLADLSAGKAQVIDDTIIISDLASAIALLQGTAKPPVDTDNVPLSRQRAFANSDGFRFRGKGIAGTATKTTTTNIDYKLLEERYINGVEIITKNHVFDDSLKFQVVDKEYAYAGVLYPATYTGGIAWSVAQPNGVVLDEFGTDWYLQEDRQSQSAILLPYPARILANLYIRIVYASVGTVNDVQVKANLFLHKKS